MKAQASAAPRDLASVFSTAFEKVERSSVNVRGNAMGNATEFEKAARSSGNARESATGFLKVTATENATVLAMETERGARSEIGSPTTIS